MKKIAFYILCIGLGLSLIINGRTAVQEIKKYQKGLALGLYQFPGIIFSGLEDTLKDIQIIGYYTDRNLKDRASNRQLSQAQYMLAPTLLDTTSTDHEFVLLDCSSPQQAAKKIREIHAVPYKKNPFGIILARKLP